LFPVAWHWSWREASKKPTGMALVDYQSALLNEESILKKHTTSHLDAKIASKPAVSQTSERLTYRHPPMLLMAIAYSFQIMTL
jgi:hypothetical protein